ncbi:hypothetical protein PVT25_19185 [Paenarthrobacter ureafaciens]|uniref:hypothetical protein n=1 Tax=Paenarthrobacter ureafaciens TaxID=37931 RepID=UPI002931AA7A|nr:hypothetical protein [Paenarthrobacter ureafaciens]WNZ03734.1 hypothetical protein PVT25_19185 [Paenarthrobacter ureafaciens]
MRRRLLAFAVLAGAILAGCSTAPKGLAALDREMAQEDALPSYVAEGVNLDAGSSRLLVEHLGVRYFVANGPDEGSQCIAVVPEDATAWVVGCGGTLSSKAIVTVSARDGSETKLVNDRVDADRPEYQGLTRIHENVLISTLSHS